MGSVLGWVGRLGLMGEFVAWCSVEFVRNVRNRDF